MMHCFGTKPNNMLRQTTLISDLWCGVWWAYMYLTKCIVIYIYLKSHRLIIHYFIVRLQYNQHLIIDLYSRGYCITCHVRNVISTSRLEEPISTFDFELCFIRNHHAVVEVVVAKNRMIVNVMYNRTSYLCQNSSMFE